MLDKVGLRFAALGLSRNKINASINLHDVLRLIGIGEPCYTKTMVGQSYEMSRQRHMETGIPSPGLATAGGPTGGTVLLWLKFLLLRSYTGPPARPGARGRGVAGVDNCTASRWML